MLIELMDLGGRAKLAGETVATVLKVLNDPSGCSRPQLYASALI